MTLLDILLLLLIAAVVGAVAQRLVGYAEGGLIVTIALGFIGAVVGSWLAQQLGLPELFTIDVGTINFPVVWAIIGAALFVALVSLLSGGRLGISTTPPTQVVLILSLVLAILSLLSNFGSLSLPASAYLLMASAYLLLLIGNLFKGI